MSDYYEDDYEEDEFGGDSDRFDAEDDEDSDSIICPLCGELAWLMDGSYVCDFDGDVSEDE